MALDAAAKVLLAPLLIAQGLRVRKTALILPEPPGPREGTSGKGPDLRLLIVGDSSAAGVGAASQGQALSGQLVQALSPDFRVDWRLIARTGATTASTLQKLQGAALGQYDAVVVALGVNDITRGVPLRRWIGQQGQLWDLLTGRFGARRIYVSGLPPMKDFPLLPHPLRWVLGRQAARYDQALRQAASARPGCAYVQLSLSLDASAMAEDGFHPGPDVYREWSALLARMIAAEAG